MGTVDTHVMQLIHNEFECIRSIAERKVRLDGDPGWNSVARVECQVRGAEYAYHQTFALLAGAIDHLHTLHSVLFTARELPSFAGMTLMRASFEACLTARWVLDGDAASRLARGVAVQWSDLDERRKVEAALGASKDWPTGTPAQQRQGDLFDLARTLGLSEEVTDKSANPYERLKVQTRPWVELADLYPSGASEPGRKDGWVYRYLSGFAHSKQWPQLLNLTQTTGNANGTAAGISEADEAHVLGMLIHVRMQLDHAVSSLEKLYR
jgi:hypothetical protein